MQNMIIFDLLSVSLWVCVKISLQIVSGKARTQQGAKIKAYPAYFVFLQCSFAGCMGGVKVKLFLREP
jgi:hypothetical protein